MPSSPLQHLLKLLQVVSDHERSSDASQSNPNARSPYSFGDGVQFLEEFKKRLAGPIARSTPHTSPEKNQGKRDNSKIPDRRLSFSMPDLHKLSPINGKLRAGNATGPSGTSEKKKRKLEFK